MTLTVYGIKNCSSVKKALTILDDQQIPYDFFDFKKQEMTQDLLDTFISEFGMDKVLNKRSTTWRKLSDEEKETASHDGCDKNNAAKDLMIAQPNLIKRPIILGQDKTKTVATIGFDHDAIIAAIS